MSTVTTRYGVLPLISYEPVRAHTRSRTASQHGQLSLDDLSVPGRARSAAPAQPTSGLDRRMIQTLLTGLLEAHSGRRPVTQLSAWLSPALLLTLRARARTWGPRYLLHRVHVCLPSDTAVEACGTAYAQGRASAVTARFEYGVGGWRCVSFALLTNR